MCPVSRIFSVKYKEEKTEREMNLGVRVIICLVKRIHFIKYLITSSL